MLIFSSFARIIVRRNLTDPLKCPCPQIFISIHFFCKCYSRFFYFQKIESTLTQNYFYLHVWISKGPQITFVDLNSKFYRNLLFFQSLSIQLALVNNEIYIVIPLALKKNKSKHYKFDISPSNIIILLHITNIWNYSA